MLFHYDLSVLIHVLLVVGTIVAAYCQENTKAKRTMISQAKNNKQKKLRSREGKSHKSQTGNHQRKSRP